MNKNIVFAVIILIAGMLIVSFTQGIVLSNVVTVPATEEVTYYFPWECGTTAIVTQGYHASGYKIDFGLSGNASGKKIVTAAADGEVIEAVWDSNTTCAYENKKWVYPSGHPQEGKSCPWEEANRVIIRHRDGKESSYLHLAYDTIPERFRGASRANPIAVFAGEPIGEEGQTGYAHAPHLHFHIMSGTDYIEFNIKNGTENIHSSELTPEDPIKHWTSHNCPAFKYVVETQELPPAVMSPEQTAFVRFIIRNTGTLTWVNDPSLVQNGEALVRLGTNDNPLTRDNEGQDHPSVFYNPDDPNWLQTNRLTFSNISGWGTVYPTAQAFFDFYIRAPITVGVHHEYFQVVAEGQKWFDGPGFNFTVGVCGSLSPGQRFCDVPPSDGSYTATHAITFDLPQGEVPFSSGCYSKGGYRFYCPDEEATRAQLSIMLARWLYQKEFTQDSDFPAASVVRELFVDMSDKLPASQRFNWEFGARAIQMIFLDGIAHGNSKFEFMPDKSITRAETVIMVMNALLNHDLSELERVSEATKSVFPDVTANTTGSRAIWRAYELGVVQGFSDGAFRPDNSVTRRELAHILYNAFLKPNVNQDLLRLRSIARIVDEPKDSMICLSASRAADEKLRAKGLPYIGIFTDADDGLEVCYCGNDTIYSTNRCNGEVHTITTDTEATVTFTAPRGSNNLSTRVHIPKGAVSEATDLRYMEVINLKIPQGFALSDSDERLVYAGRAFKFEAYRQPDGFLGNFRFNQPIEITLGLDGLGNLNVDQLQLFYWDDQKSNWLLATEEGCGTGKPTFNRADNTITIPVCHLSEFSLFEIAPGSDAKANTIIPLNIVQSAPHEAYRAIFAHLYNAERGQWAMSQFNSTNFGSFDSGTIIIPGTVLKGSFTAYHTTELPTLPRAYALTPRRIGIFASSAMITLREGGNTVMAMWETAPTRGVFDDYLMGAAPHTILDEAQLADGLAEYGLLILPSFNRAAYDEVIGLLEASGGMDAIRDFVAQGGTLYAQGTGLLIAQAAGVLPAGTVDAQAVMVLRDEDAFSNRGVLDIVQPDSPLAYSWLTNTLYLLDDPVLYPDEEGVVEVVAVLTNTTAAEPLPAVIRARYGAGQVLGVAGHPTDALRRSQVPLFMNALLLALSGEAEFYGDAIQTWNPAYDPHEFPAYETVPVNVTLNVKNLWDKPQYEAVVVEQVSRGYDVLTDTISPAPDDVQILPDGGTVITWTLGVLAPNVHLVLSYQANTRPETLGAGRDTFSTGTLTYKELPSGVETVFLPDQGATRLMAHRPFVLTARMAANLKGYLSLEGDRHYRLPADGLYLDLAVVLENKEETVAPNTRATLWPLLIAPMVDIENQHVILSANDGETIWVKNEPFLWGPKYPLWDGATSPTQTVTLETWRALPEAERRYCTFTSTRGIHIDPPGGQRPLTEDYGSFVTIPPGYEDAVTVTAKHELLLPCYPLTWDLGTFPAYWYEEPALRWGVHSRELLEREVVAHGTPREGVVVLPYDAASVYVMAGGHPIPYREYLEHEVAYTPQPPTPVGLTYEDVWARPHTLEFNAVFYDFWKWDSCATCDGSVWSEQHAGFAVTYELVADLDNDGVYETFVREIPTRQAYTLLRMLGKTYSDTFGDHGWTIPAEQNILDLPVFRGLGVRIRPLENTWYDSYQSIGPGQSTLVDVIEAPAYMHLLFQQEIPQGSWAAFLVDALIENYPGVNKEAATKLHDGGRLAYRQMYAGPNNFEITDAHPHVPESLATNGALRKRSGPQVVSIYSPTIVSQIDVTDLYDPREFAKAYDPFIKSWGYGDLVWTTYGGGREGKTLFSTEVWTGDRLYLRVALDQNLGFRLTGLDIQPQPFPWMTITKLYTDPATAPEPIQPELAFLNRTEVPDAWRGVWYFEVVMGEVPDDYRGQVIDIPIHVVADNLPTDKPYNEIPPLRIALRAPGDPAPQYVSAPAGGIVLTDTLPANVTLDAAAWITDTAALQDLWAALDLDAGDPLSSTARVLFEALVAEGRALPVAWTQTGDVVTFELPDAWQHFPAAQGNLSLVTLATLTRARHGANVANAGATLCYTDPFGVTWCEATPPVTVYAHGAAPWVEYTCNGGWDASTLAGTPRVFAHGGACWIPGDEPSEAAMTITGYNDGDAVARTVTLTLQIPAGITVTVRPPGATLAGRDLIFHLGDLAPGAWRSFGVVLHIAPEESVLAADAAHLLGIRRTDGAFTDDYSKSLIHGQVGDAFWFNLYAAARLTRVYLPVVTRAYDARPDLVIERVTVDPDDPAAVQVVIANTGRSAARNFWLDLYFNPAQPPAGNQPWPLLCEFYGAAWQVTALGAGERMTLTLGGAFYRLEDSQWPQGAYPAGEHAVWAYVDSLGLDANGGVSEMDETNNRYGPVTFTAPESQQYTTTPQPAHTFLPRVQEP